MIRVTEEPCHQNHYPTFPMLCKKSKYFYKLKKTSQSSAHTSRGCFNFLCIVAATGSFNCQLSSPRLCSFCCRHCSPWLPESIQSRTLIKISDSDSHVWPSDSRTSLYIDIPWVDKTRCAATKVSAAKASAGQGRTTRRPNLGKTITTPTQSKNILKWNVHNKCSGFWKTT